MAVELNFTHSSAKKKYVFSVFPLDRSSTERVYQLEVTQALRKPKDTHGHSHEHIGDQRFIGPASWRNWSYDEVLAYFCAQTNITFLPFPPCP
jgi:hypothetical protein